MAKEEITIRVLNPTTQKHKFLFPSIANNKQLMKNMGFIISDPQYDAKMEAYKNNKPFSANGQTNEPVKEAFAPKSEPNNIISTPEIKDEPVKRKRRTKEQMLADKNKPKQTT